MNKDKNPMNLVYFILAYNKLFESYFSILPINKKVISFSQTFLQL